MSEALIRRIEPQDRQALLRVFCAAWQEEFSQHLAQPLSVAEVEALASEALQSSTGWMLEQDSQPLGYLIYQQSLENGGIEVLHWYVDPRRQGEGVGFKLFEVLIGSLAGQTAHWWAWEGNQRANRAYQNMGASITDRRRMKTIGATRFYYQRWRLNSPLAID